MDNLTSHQIGLTEYLQLEDFDLDILSMKSFNIPPWKTEGNGNRYLGMDLSELFEMVESKSCRITQNDIKQWLDDRRTLVENSLADSKSEMEAPVDIVQPMEKQLRKIIDAEEGGMSIEQLKNGRKALKMKSS